MTPFSGLPNTTLILFLLAILKHTKETPWFSFSFLKSLVRNRNLDARGLIIGFIKVNPKLEKSLGYELQVVAHLTGQHETF